eukprot:Opistho-2@7845
MGVYALWIVVPIVHYTTVAAKLKVFGFCVLHVAVNPGNVEEDICEVRVDRSACFPHLYGKRLWPLAYLQVKNLPKIHRKILRKRARLCARNLLPVEHKPRVTRIRLDSSTTLDLQRRTLVGRGDRVTVTHLGNQLRLTRTPPQFPLCLSRNSPHLLRVKGILRWRRRLVRRCRRRSVPRVCPVAHPRFVGVLSMRKKACRLLCSRPRACCRRCSNARSTYNACIRPVIAVVATLFRRGGNAPLPLSSSLRRVRRGQRLLVRLFVDRPLDNAAGSCTCHATRNRTLCEASAACILNLRDNARVFLQTHLILCIVISARFRNFVLEIVCQSLPVSFVIRGNFGHAQSYRCCRHSCSLALLTYLHPHGRHSLDKLDVCMLLRVPLLPGEAHFSKILSPHTLEPSRLTLENALSLQFSPNVVRSLPQRNHSIVQIVH